MAAVPRATNHVLKLSIKKLFQSTKFREVNQHTELRLFTATYLGEITCKKKINYSKETPLASKHLQSDQSD